MMVGSVTILDSGSKALEFPGLLQDEQANFILLTWRWLSLLFNMKEQNFYVENICNLRISVQMHDTKAILSDTEV